MNIVFINFVQNDQGILLQKKKKKKKKTLKGKPVANF